MNWLRHSFWVVMILLAGTSCRQEEEITLRDYPFIESLGVSDLNQTGVSVNFEIKKAGRNSIQEHGLEYFLSSPNANPTEFADVMKVSQAGSPSGEVASLRIQYDLIDGRNYLVRPYVKAGETTVYGEFLPFTSLGTSPPVVTEVSPTSFYKSARITIKGDFFNSRIENNEVRIPELENDFRVTLLSATNQQLEILVENTSYNFQPTEQKFDLLIKSGGKTVTLSDVFSITVPSILSVEPRQVYVGEKLRIFTSYPELNITYDFLLQSGENFIQEIYPLTTLEGGVYEGSVGSLPTGPSFIRMSFPGYFSQYSQPIEILPSWEVFQDGLNVPQLHEFRKYPFGDRIIFWKNSGDEREKFYQLQVGNTSLEAFQDEANQPFQRIAELMVGLNDRYIYYGLGVEFSGNDEIHHKDFHRYDFQTGRWERLGDFPFDFSHVVKSFSVNGKIYAVLFNYLNFREYDPITDQWRLSEIQVPSEVRNTNSWVVVGDYFYFVSGNSTLQIKRYRIGGQVEPVANGPSLFNFQVNMSEWKGNLLISDGSNLYRLDLNTLRLNAIQRIYESPFSYFISWPTSQGFLQALPVNGNSYIQENKVYRLIQEF